MALSGSVFSEENFRKVFKNALIGTLIIDPEMKWRFVNQRFCEIAGYSKDESFADDVQGWKPGILLPIH